MVALGIGLVFVGYSIGLYGYILLRGYNIAFTQMFSFSTWPPAGKEIP
jgi:hypothetical protein